MNNISELLLNIIFRKYVSVSHGLVTRSHGLVTRPCVRGRLPLYLSCGLVKYSFDITGMEVTTAATVTITTATNATYYYYCNYYDYYWNYY